jgi:carboxynorspermidine decarboxylase
MNISTPYYLIDERKLLRNMDKIAEVKRLSGARSVLALKCFAAWAVFGLMKKYMDGTTSSSLFEARLGREKFGKETHAYCVGFNNDEIKQVRRYADKVIFNSISQLRKYAGTVRPLKTGIRINPLTSYSHFDLADPARRYSRLGVSDKRELLEFTGLYSGAMFHFNCENDDFNAFSSSLGLIGRNYGDILSRLEWVSLGGGLSFTKEGYPLQAFCGLLKKFSDRFGVQVYLEPGEAAITRSAELVTSVVDIVRNEIDIAIVDASAEAHLLDLLIYRTGAKIDVKGNGRYHYMVAGRSCLAGDVFGTFKFATKLKTGSTIHIVDAAGYSMVKKNWFNGLQMPAIAIKKLNGDIVVKRRFSYTDFVNGLS